MRSQLATEACGAVQPRQVRLKQRTAIAAPAVPPTRDSCLAPMQHMTKLSARPPLSIQRACAKQPLPTTAHLHKAAPV